ncbi:hypothetical protein WKK05_09615 [Nostoc sp. UHCC 0302]|uniref:hypothetical protein n=1 Tax=Nostoc sp. UHCC 0302 TaxID=3134896 RepID=UPI00311CAD5C
MVNHKQIVYHPIQSEHLEPGDRAKLFIHNHDNLRHFRTQQTLASRILKAIAISSILSAGFFGIGALGCWGLEIFDVNTKLTIVNKQDWLARKHICLGWMLVGFSSFLASASFDEKPL